MDRPRPKRSQGPRARADGQEQLIARGVTDPRVLAVMRRLRVIARRRPCRRRTAPSAADRRGADDLGLHRRADDLAAGAVRREKVLNRQRPGYQTAVLAELAAAAPSSDYRAWPSVPGRPGGDGVRQRLGPRGQRFRDGPTRRPDCIIVTAGAVGAASLIQQLADGGACAGRHAENQVLTVVEAWGRDPPADPRRVQVREARGQVCLGAVRAGPSCTGLPIGA